MIIANWHCADNFKLRTCNGFYKKETVKESHQLRKLILSHVNIITQWSSMTLIIPISLVDSYCGRPFKTEENGHTLQDIAESEMVYHSASWYLRRARQRRMGHFIASDTVLDQGGSRGAGGTPPPLLDEAFIFIFASISVSISISSIFASIYWCTLSQEKVCICPWEEEHSGKNHMAWGSCQLWNPRKIFTLKCLTFVFLIGIRILFHGCGASSLTT